ncbi:MAG: hypothetical protein QF898_14900 [SAR202 cluster bacterium]|jgi:hypothetical protein|nr:hypothetical protein [SAR202 cluster bacterium]MDP6512789.1 hypothetical protein [SAR202 cluster bacterium]MDP6713695.1 hypothetical protein [SAR202 cluster bacterium]
MKKFSRMKIRFGRLTAPVWMVGLIGLLIIAAAGQAVGPVLSGSIQGSAGLVVEQSLLLSATSTNNTVVYTEGHSDDALVTVSDEGAAFTAAIEMHVGDDATLKLKLNNGSDAVTNAVMELNAPRGIDVEVESSSGGEGLKEAQLTRTSWLMQVPSGNSDTINITLEGRDTLTPGFYTVTGRIIQVAN